jgi:N-acyl-D-aspartate/D-glutamate deacylase
MRVVQASRDLGLPDVASPQPHDLVVTGGLLVDGTGAAPAPADIGITGDLITALAPAGSLVGHQQIDASRHLVTPGFVDIHSHADFTILVDGRAHSALLQGVTSIVTGNCGYGAPFDSEAWRTAAMDTPGWRLECEPGESWYSFDQYLEVLRQRGVAVNVFPLVSHAALRTRVAGHAAGTLSRAQEADMRALTREAMRAGAVGLSTGLEYAPGIIASDTELHAIAAAAGDSAGLYATHCRNRSEHVVAAADEAVRLAAETGCRLQLSHFLPRPTFADRTAFQQALALARTADVEVRFDVFPFDHGPTMLSTVLPTWAREGNRADVAERLASPRQRARAAADLDVRFIETIRAGLAADMYLTADGADGNAVGKTLGALSRGRPIAETVLDLLSQAGENFSDVTVVERWATWSDLYDAFSASDYLIMGDGVTSCLDGALAGHGFSLSDWGYAPAMLANFVRDHRVTTLEDAIHRMTLAPARQAGLLDRGVIAPGKAADLVVLDLARLVGNSDPGRPQQPSSGVRDVIVNGDIAVSMGRATAALSGQVGRPR